MPISVTGSRGAVSEQVAETADEDSASRWQICAENAPPPGPRTMPCAQRLNSLSLPAEPVPANNEPIPLELTCPFHRFAPSS